MVVSCWCARRWHDSVVMWAHVCTQYEDHDGDVDVDDGDGEDAVVAANVVFVYAKHCL